MNIAPRRAGSSTTSGCATLAAYVDQRADGERLPDDLDGAIDAGTRNRAAHGERDFVQFSGSHQSTRPWTSEGPAARTSGWLKSSTSQSRPRARHRRHAAATRRQHCTTSPTARARAAAAAALAPRGRRCASCALRFLAEGDTRQVEAHPRPQPGPRERDFERGREFARSQRQRRRLAVERVHQVGAVGARKR